jgi:hypothetical protein
LSLMNRGITGIEESEANTLLEMRPRPLAQCQDDDQSRLIESVELLISEPKTRFIERCIQPSSHNRHPRSWFQNPLQSGRMRSNAAR